MQAEPFEIRPMTEKEAEAVCGWNYEPPYDIYGWMPWEEVKKLGIEFGDPELRARQYVTVHRGGVCYGFAQLFPLGGTTRLGIGMRPDLCGRGLGSAFVRAVAEEALRRIPGQEIDLEVLTWNQRAIKAYQKAGFAITDLYERMTPAGMKPFYCMVYQPPAE
ncbi:GNAT family N-acetyltransferase [Saccharibacillus alkalitolerans]|uniref:GNAT family N-acetyltransferase n=1 Tax=Saccharibacillus alkalitolerans TaxID=2705290 RepID=A0ABX0FCN7_9BACL|nr:GNAT family N-acetyltransferase [Saccharibacillus alkalitolerans]NGZ78205.1 GNAT family N-acetyltransferase [Saccharibacillus alkalitolerans]